MKRLTLLLTLLLATATTGCVVRGNVGARAYVEPQAELVYVSPGVYVVADYDEPVFYSDNYYWAQRDGYWYRSGYYSGGWVRVQSAPHVIAQIDRPRGYVRYRGEGRARIRARDHRGGGQHQVAPAHRSRGRGRDHRR